MVANVMLGMMSPVALAVQGLYGVGTTVAGAGTAVVAGGAALNTFLNDHIQSMKGSENATISRTGRVFEMTKYGFGIGWISGVAIIAAGQLILGNSFFSTTAALITAPVNPIAMTCAAIGAVYYGWNVLSEGEKTEILEKLSKGLEIGTAFISSIIAFVLETCKKIFSAENLEELKKFVGKCAAVFGKTLSSITHKITDVVADAYLFIKQKSADAYDATVEITEGAYDRVAESADSVTKVIKGKLSSDKTEVHLEPAKKRPTKRTASPIARKPVDKKPVLKAKKSRAAKKS